MFRIVFHIYTECICLQTVVFVHTSKHVHEYFVHMLSNSPSRASTRFPDGNIDASTE